MAFMVFMAFIAPGFFMTAFMAFIGSAMAGAANKSTEGNKAQDALLDVDGLSAKWLEPKWLRTDGAREKTVGGLKASDIT
eukprot:CAMPEP_0185904054 /NCGR_PEP_ID=MMETSP0196C-20130402/3345_1 /TAXON_ID=2932 /ORGANISM="Alexandrium fundyense, Strain CCMP1719" /LENGTH=79 /DNA_ID=CAMNT_0028623259 /DNA_START=76 /DNA_END=312 /DNA_ORIENTATION=-